MIRLYAVTVAVFVAAKVVFIACCGARHGVTVGDVWAVLGHGLTLDLSTALYFMAVPLLLTMVAVWTRVPRWLWKVYFGVVAAAFALAFVADTSLYPFWGFKLDASCLQYLEQPEGITSSVSIGYLVVRAVAMVATAFVVYRLFLATEWTRKGHGGDTDFLATERTRRGYGGDTDFLATERTWNGHGGDTDIFATERTRNGHGGDTDILGTERTRRGHGYSRMVVTAGYVLLVPLLVVGIRGGVHESTTNIGQVYYSQNQFQNHAAVNPVFSFLYSLGHQAGDLSAYQFMTDEECRRLTEGVYTTASVYASDSICKDDRALTDTLLKTQRPDIVIILLESCGEQFAEVMPRLQQLKREGVSFSRCYGNSWRTDRGTVCALSGYPSFPSLSVMKMPEKSRQLPSIARTLRAHGYVTRYIYGGDINFTDMRSYLIATGWERLTSMDDYTAAERRSAQWGVRDDITFRTVEEAVVGATAKATVDATMSRNRRQDGEGAAGKQRVLVGYSTLSSHEPWDVPGERRSEDEVLNAFGYLDECLGDFVNRMKQSAAWENLLIVLTADHGINHGDIDQSRPLAKNHIPMVWIGGAVRGPRVVSTICNQSDLAATLLGQMGLAHEDFLFSRDVLSTTYTHPVAVHNYNNAQWAIDSTGHCLYDFDARRFIVSEGQAHDSLLQVSKAMLQVTTENLQAINQNDFTD